MVKGVTTFSKEKEFDDYVRGFDIECFYDISSLYDSNVLNEDSNPITSFSGLKHGGSYRIKFKLQYERIRCQLDDHILQIESSFFLENELKNIFPRIHTHNNLIVSEEGIHKAEFDCIIHGDLKLSTETIGFLVEAKYCFNEKDIPRILEKVKKLEWFIKEKVNWDCTLNGKEFSFKHFHNMNKIIPCVASAYFPPELIKKCHENGFITIAPSGMRYSLQNFPKLI